MARDEPGQLVDFENFCVAVWRYRDKGGDDAIIRTPETGVGLGGRSDPREIYLPPGDHSFSPANPEM